ncbi:MAG: hypothetical protein AAF390_15255 [Pseudomonadota bacterium]
MRALLLLLLTSPAAAQVDTAETMRQAIAICARLVAGDGDPPAGWTRRGAAPVPARQAAPGLVRSWDHPMLDLTLRLADWPDVDHRACTLSPHAPAFEDGTADGRARIPVEAARAALDVAPPERWAWPDGTRVHCAAGCALTHVTSDLTRARLQTWVIHQETATCATPDG